MVALSDRVDARSATLPNRLPSLTGMRFVAAASVYFFHAAYDQLFASPGGQQTYAGIVGQAGFSGVSFFFVLSGFVLTWSARPTDTVSGFWLRRACKIYPNHIVTFVAAFLLLTMVSGQTVHGSDAVPNLLLVHSWIPQPETLLSLNNVSWSLASEVLFYLAFPLLILLARRIRPERLWAWAIGTVVVIFLIPAVAYALPSEPAWGNAAGGFWRFWFTYFLPAARLPEFVLGILLARIVATGRKLPLGLGGSVALAVVAYALAPLFPGTFPSVAITALPLGLVIAAGAAADTENRPTFMSSRLMVWLGEVSFAFYMCHWLILSYGHHWLADSAMLSTPVALALIVLLFGITIGVAWLMFVLVERPIMRSVGAYLRRRRAVPSNPRPAEAPGPAPDEVVGA